ncbi:hypothetical protein ACLBKU_02695 [Erythrobacter sp. NE805]|uniref:hypothetical protein n=1 Tax=Erythrobacter sp. NE805 TaxID=3389875 RepID=UPI00396B17D1
MHIITHACLQPIDFMQSACISTQMSKPALPGACAYPSSPSVQRAIRSCTRAGIAIGAVEMRPDGTIRIVTQGAITTDPANDFDRLDALGVL